METTEGLLDKIVPPRLEDAGLEDCALSPDAIKEAFLKAATAVRSIISTSDDEDDGHCVNDPWPTAEDSVASDVLVGIKEGTGSPPGDCAAVKGGGVPDLAGDEVALGGGSGSGSDGEDIVDEVVGPAMPEAGKACVDGLRGLKIGEKGEEVNSNEKKLDNDEDEEEEKEKERPILVEGYV